MSRSKEAHCLRRAHGPAWKSCPQVGTSVVPDESLEPSGTHSNIQGSATATVKAEERSKYRTERMAKRLIPLLDRVLVQKIQAPSKSIGGVLLPETASKVNEAQVVAVGPGRRNLQNGEAIPVSVKEGDKVLLPEYGGQTVKLDDSEYFLYRDDELLGILSS